MTQADDNKASWNECDTRAFWAEISGLSPDDLIFPPPALGWKHRLRATLGRWPWIERHIGPSPRTAPLPLNLSPWTNEALPGLHDGVPASALARLHDRWLWVTAHPDTRYETLEWHRRRRRTSVLVWRIARFRATLIARAPGAPPWIRKTGAS